MSRRAIKLIDPENQLAALALSQPRLRRDFGPVRYWSRFESNRARVNALIYELIRDRRRAASLDQREDILSILLQSTFSDKEVHDELITLVLAGHETTATALSWTFDLLLHHRGVMERLREELKAGDEEYLTAVVHEALRFRPVVATSQRVVREPVEIKGYTFEPGVTVLPAIWLVHRRADLYGPDPYVFRPERFLGVRPGTYEWLPFGGGGSTWRISGRTALGTGAARGIGAETARQFHARGMNVVLAGLERNSRFPLAAAPLSVPVRLRRQRRSSTFAISARLAGDRASTSTTA